MRKPRSYLPEAGQYQCLMLYLSSVLGFSAGELAAFIAVTGSLAVVAQTTMLTSLTARFGSSRRVLLVGLALQTLQLSMFGLGSSRWVVWPAGVVAAASSITYPAVSALVSDAASDDQQGAVQGMITGIRALCTGLGPVVFAMLFQLSDVALREDGAGVSSALPGMPFLVGAVCVAAAWLVAWTVPERFSLAGVQE